jgi:hypothetical protein
MARLRFRGRRPANGGMMMLVALGAVTGVALGVVLAERTGGLDGLKSRVRELRRRRIQADDPESMRLLPAVQDDDVEPDTLVPSGATGPDDEELEARVLEAFRNDPTLRGRAIDIGAIGDGIIELTGWVQSAAEVGHALTLARGVPDVAHVMDSLTIRGVESSRVGPPSSDR